MVLFYLQYFQQQQAQFLYNLQSCIIHSLFVIKNDAELEKDDDLP